MAAVRKSAPRDETPRRRPPGTTPEAREIQLISLAVDLAEQQIRDGTASAQVLTHYLKLASSRERLEQQRIQSENELLRARVNSLAATERIEELYTKAISAMMSYQGRSDPIEDDYAD